MLLKSKSRGTKKVSLDSHCEFSLNRSNIFFTRTEAEKKPVSCNDFYAPQVGSMQSSNSQRGENVLHIQKRLTKVLYIKDTSQIIVRIVPGIYKNLFIVNSCDLLTSIFKNNRCLNNSAHYLHSFGGYI